MEVVTRFAPSPTGYLHIGGLRTALYNYLFARANGGKFLLRIEDTDLSRNSAEAAQAIIESFKWVNLEYDGVIEYQSKRFDIYTKYIQRLLQEGKAYHCYMHKDELDSLRARAQMEGKVWKYDNRYRDFKGEVPQGIKPVVRIKAPLDGEIKFKDGIKGEMNFKACEMDDFIIARSDGVPTYNFVVAIDDALMGITHVIRGDDHLSNTPRQIIIYNALGFKVPEFFHIPMILNEKHHKLSKRDGAMSVMEYKKLGYLPEALLNFILRLGWGYENEELFTFSLMLEKFNPYDINSAPSCYNLSKLNWINSQYLKNTSNKQLKELLDEFGLENLDSKIAPHALDNVFTEIKERSQTLLDFKANILDVIEMQEYDAKLLKKLDSEGLAMLGEFASRLQAQSLDSLDEINQFIHNFTESMAIKMGQIMPVLRLAILGKSSGISVASAIFALGRDEVISRIKKLLNKESTALVSKAGGGV